MCSIRVICKYCVSCTLYSHSLGILLLQSVHRMQRAVTQWMCRPAGQDKMATCIIHLPHQPGTTIKIRPHIIIIIKALRLMINTEAHNLIIINTQVLQFLGITLYPALNRRMVIVVAHHFPCVPGHQHPDTPLTATKANVKVDPEKLV